MTELRKRFPVSARHIAGGWKSFGISFDDYARMGVQQHKQSGERRLPTPDWAIADKKLRLLLVNFMEERAGFRRKRAGTLAQRLQRAQTAIIDSRPRLIDIMDRLCTEYVTLKRLGLNPETTDKEWNDVRQQPFMEIFEGEARHVAENSRKRELEIEIAGLDTFLRISEKDGGAGIIAAVPYLYYRVGLDSVGVGEHLHIRPPHVRQILWRLFQTAEKLWPTKDKEAVKQATPFDEYFA